MSSSMRTDNYSELVGDTWITDWPTSQRFPHYTRANAGEVLANPVSPLGWTFGWDGGIVDGYRAGLIRLGAYEANDFDATNPETVACFGGYFYINLSAIRMQGVRNPDVTVALLDAAFFGDHPDVPPYVAHPSDDKPHLEAAIRAHTEWVLSGPRWPQLTDDRADAAMLRHSRPDLSTLSDRELLDRARAAQARLPHLFSQHVVSGSSAAMAPGMLGAAVHGLEEPGLVMSLLSSLGDVDSADASYALWELSRIVRHDPPLTGSFDAGLPASVEDLESPTFSAAWASFLHQFGSRGPDEWDLASPTWETHPQLALAALDRVRLQADNESPSTRNANGRAVRHAALERVRHELAGQPDLLALFEGGVAASEMMAHRERTKTTIVRVLHEARMAVRELGRRHGHEVLVFQLLDAELDAYIVDPDSFTGTLEQRRSLWQHLFELEPPFIIANASVPPLSEWPRRHVGRTRPVSPGDVLQGVSGAPGIARGRVRVVLDPSEPGDLQPGDVLVAPNTDPSWTPLFMAAGAVVVDVGGQISHAVIVSRELGLPCAISVTDASRRIPDGTPVEVNGNTGTVTILDDLPEGSSQ